MKNSGPASTLIAKRLRVITSVFGRRQPQTQGGIAQTLISRPKRRAGNQLCGREQMDVDITYARTDEPVPILMG